MNRIIWVLIVWLACLPIGMVGCGGTPELKTEGLILPEIVIIELYIDNLRAKIVPSQGTLKSEVTNVFGEPKEVEEWKGKGSKTKYPMYIYQLLPPKGNQEFRAVLCVTYENDRVTYAAINHQCVTKSRIKNLNISEVEEEKRRVLDDLSEIYEKHHKKIEEAQWGVPGSYEFN